MKESPSLSTDAADLERSLWQIMEKVTCGKPSYTFTPREYGWEHHDREMWQSRHRPPPITQLQLAKWRRWRPAELRDLEPTTQRPLKKNYGNIGPTGLLAIWPLMLRTSRRWRQWWETEMTMKSSFIFWEMPASVLSGRGALPWKSSRNMEVSRSRGRRNQSGPSWATFISKSVPQTTSNKLGILWSGSAPSFKP